MLSHPAWSALRRAGTLGLAALVFPLTFAAGCGSGGTQSDDCGDDPCLTPPAATCNGNQRVSFGLIGECRDGSCIYAPITETCAAGCSDGSCSAEPCGGACTNPPAPRCDGAIALSYSGGTCDASSGECVYDELRDDCATAGTTCVDGACVATCTDGCTTPPAPGCDGDVAISFGAGTCVDGECEFPSTTTDCAAAGRVCVEGGCVERDACTGVSCTTPPAPACDSGVLVSYEPTGTCRAGECMYFEVRTACAELEEGGRCVSGRCVGPDLCLGVTCNRPPPLFCDENELVRSTRPGTCVDGDCVYIETRTDCSPEGGRCLDGACTGPDPCLGVACDEPPAPECRSNVLVTYDAGYCEAGECVWTQARSDCAASGQRCVRGACVEATAPCDEVCDEPPSPVCDGNVLTTFVIPSGECDAATCRYETVTTNCAASGGFCDAGRCVATDPCVGVRCDAPPAPACVGSTLYRYAATGTCVSGSCTYGATALDCAFDGGVCAAGACDYGAACAGVVCDEPPPWDCEGSVAVRYAGGECRGGSCAYEPTREDCAASGARCSAGICVPIDPCIGVECITPPPATCEAGVAVSWRTPGTCSDGECEFEAVRVRCADSGRFCSAGACVDADPCAGVACNRPPAGTCDGLLRTSYGAGICVDGACAYPRETYDCTLDGAICSGNECVGAELCAGVTCDEPPGDVCIGGVAQKWRPIGVCRAGTCTYERYDDNCAARGEFCTMGACSVTDPCASVACSSPPEPAYCDGAVAVSFPVPAACSDGICRYASQRVDCAARGQRCELGVCVTDDPCMGISCSTPPAAVCVGDQAWQFELPGGCLDGECSYNTLVTDCAADGLRCVGGECIDPCEGVTCETPPPRCGPDNALIVAERPTCEGGVCSFVERAQPCPDGWYCDGSECVDPCDSVVCDEQISWCVGDIRGYRALPGTCSGFGFCGYSTLTEDCAARGERCVAGQCVTGDPCAVVSCPATSGRTCDGNTAVAFDGGGVCFDGACDYSAVSVRTDCGSLACLDGACVEPLLPLAGQLVVTEVFARPAGGASEWIELVSLAPARVNLGGVQVRNAVGASWTIPAGTLLDPLERLVLASGAVAGSSRTLVWSGIALGDTTDTLVLSRAGIELSRLAYDAATGWPVVSGVAMQSDPLALLLGPGERRLWCRADAAEAGVPAGTPSSANGACFACDDNADCPAGAAVCEGDVVLDYGDLLCLSGYCAAFAQIARVDCSDVGAVCRDGACTAP